MKPSQLLAATLIFSGMAMAEDCSKAQTQSEMLICADKDSRATDKALNTLYGELLRRYEPKYQVLLKDAERRWIAYRDAECRFETAATEDGSIHPMAYAQCITAKTKARITELTAQRDCAEGDFSCNKPQ
ncbi:uncharacterized protein YecT (DUF1311 family) [Rhizomicrobium palustre]|uniref:Uncharacterized protein YecT (DUF1311 family) n=1 Tax=Rhizomicrobium palustre TaxID=189966 RepID=A0A846MUW1_9PROT|nr:lysozyme inhibitor LprI family protein [Rhizomicrobium palustre]NIK87224.1 uncharacterized protein YecT (DUF1311 family) [Rhizomicrobium palustre]